MLIAAVLMMTAVFAFAQQYTAESAFGVSRTNDGAGVIINGYSGTSRTINIPPQIRGLPVTHIAKEAFSGSQVTSVTFPNTVTHIEDMAFFRSQVARVTFGSGLIRIGDRAFERCLLTSVVIPDSVTYIGYAAFRGHHRQQC